MKLRNYLIQKDRMQGRAERVFIARIKKAMIKTMQPLFEAVEQGTLKSTSQAETLIKNTFIERELRWVYVDFGYQMLRWFQKNYNPKDVKSFDWQNRLSEWFDVNGAEKVKVIYATTIDKTRELIAKALPLANSGASVDEVQTLIKKDIEASGGVISEGRARTIARTEVVGASENATYQSMRAENLNVEKQWLTGGANIRETHMAQEDLGWVPMDYEYRLAANRGFTDLMMHPHDNGSAENVVNCKCTLIYRVVD